MNSDSNRHGHDNTSRKLVIAAEIVENEKENKNNEVPDADELRHPVRTATERSGEDKGLGDEGSLTEEPDGKLVKEAAQSPDIGKKAKERIDAEKAPDEYSLRLATEAAGANEGLSAQVDPGESEKIMDALRGGLPWLHDEIFLLLADKVPPGTPSLPLVALSTSTRRSLLHCRRKFFQRVMLGWVMACEHISIDNTAVMLNTKWE